MQALILAAGFGTRMGHDKPKALLEWDGKTVIEHQLGNLRDAAVERVTVVTGFQADQVKSCIEAAGFADFVNFVDNPEYMDTNTAKSMLIGLQSMGPGGFVGLNGDVVFDHEIVQLVAGNETRTRIAVEPGVCGQEEIKYHVVEDRLVALSKEVHGQGEAVGINYFCAADRDVLEQALAYVAPQAYFERAVEHMLPYTSSPVTCTSIGTLRAVELDFPEDVEHAKQLFGK